LAALVFRAVVFLVAGLRVAGFFVVEGELLLALVFFVVALRTLGAATAAAPAAITAAAAAADLPGLALTVSTADFAVLLALLAADLAVFAALLTTSLAREVFGAAGAALAWGMADSGM
jgi:hypothetical protein